MEKKRTRYGRNMKEHKTNGKITIHVETGALDGSGTLMNIL